MRLNIIQEIIDVIKNKKIPCLGTLVDKKMGYKYKSTNEIKTLVLGSSHIACSYIAKEDEFNLGAASQDLYYNYQLYNLLNTSFVKNVVVSFSVFTPGHILIKTGEAKYCVLYKLLFGIDYQYENDAKNKFLKYYEKRYDKAIKKYLSTNNKEYSDYRGNILQYPKDNFDSKIIKETALKQYKNNQRSNNQMDYLMKLIKETEARKQNLFLVIPPATDEYKSYLPTSDIIFKKLYLSCAGFSHIKIIDLYDSSDFVKTDFCDGHHLNNNGAEKLTKTVREIIERTEELCSRD
jgi:hypothetical protein